MFFAKHDYFWSIKRLAFLFITIRVSLLVSQLQVWITEYEGMRKILALKSSAEIMEMCVGMFAMKDVDRTIGCKKPSRKKWYA
ncbi:hypothetical protein BKA66DRAFT_465095 [Pyrenochaeta sp. MPI-SDFR-AT-0127]|nr:hypothetical protein BKA66DRAFT_465095 [Pyrenochaeta sp. MPI-SDFR-AT-0127]